MSSQPKWESTALADAISASRVVGGPGIERGEAAEAERCTCGWRFAKSADDGCVPGNCSYRPSDEERDRATSERATWAEARARVEQETAAEIAKLALSHARSSAAWTHPEMAKTLEWFAGLLTSGAWRQGSRKPGSEG